MLFIEDINQTIDYWLHALEQYSFEQVCKKSAPDSWSIGQLLTHLIDDTNFYLAQIDACLSNDDYQTESPSAFAADLFRNNSFPDELIEGASSNAFIPQPGSREALIMHLQTLKQAVGERALLISNNHFKGKTKHPGLGYFNAAEWMRFAAIHFRHHLRQKQRIDHFLKSTTMRPNAITAIDAQDLKTLSIAGNAYTIVVSGKQTGGAYAIIDMEVAPHSGPIPHAHKDINESFYVLEGEVVFKSETQRYTATKGAFIDIPLGGAIHCFKNETDTPARLLCMVRPAGLDEFFLQAGKPAARGEFIPPTKPTGDEIKRIQELAVKYGQELFPPDYFDK